MSPLAWKILALFISHSKGEFGRGYIAGWTLAAMLGVEVGTIQGATVKMLPQNEYEQALHDLIELGIVEEMSDLGERFHLVVKG